jgi:hypothetical protein
MAAAQQLARAGHETLMSMNVKAEDAGGLLRYGIPDFKMEKHYTSTAASSRWKPKASSSIYNASMSAMDKTVEDSD